MDESADLSRVIALTNKATDALMKGQNARAAEKFALAAEEASERGSPDCLIKAALLESHVKALLDYSKALAPSKPAEAEDMQEQAFARLVSVVDVLLRRKAAGTLLPGTCREVEVAWCTAKTRHLVLLCQGVKQAADAASVVRMMSALEGEHMGILLFMNVAASVSSDLVRRTNTLERVREHPEKEKWLLFLAGALELIALPRPGIEMGLPGETELVRNTRKLIPLLDDTASGASRDKQQGKVAVQQLRKAWRCVLRSGVLRARGMNEHIEALNKEEASREAQVWLLLVRKVGCAHAHWRAVRRARHTRRSSKSVPRASP